MLASSNNTLTVASTSSHVAGGVPSSFSVIVGSAPVPSSRFVSALPGAVMLGSPVLSRLEDGALVTVPWSCPVSGLSGSLKCKDSGFVPGEAAEFFSALESAALMSASSGAVWYLGGAPNRSGSVLNGWFCAISSLPFKAPVKRSSGSSVVFGG